MAIYIFKTSSGVLYSWCQNDNDPVASDAILLANGLSKVSGLPVLDATHNWDPATKTVVLVSQEASKLGVIDFWRRFTPSEREALENLAATGTQGQKNKLAAFKTYIMSAGFVDCGDQYIIDSVNLMQSANIIAAGRAAQILV